MRIVADTNVLVSALFFGGAPDQIVASAIRGEVRLVTCEPLLAELSRVTRVKFKLPPEVCRDLVEIVRLLSDVVQCATVVSEVSECDADNRVLECAVDGHVDFIVTGDTKHLQPLREFRGIPILSPAEFMRILPTPPP